MTEIKEDGDKYRALEGGEEIPGSPFEDKTTAKLKLNDYRQSQETTSEEEEEDDLQEELQEEPTDTSEDKDGHGIPLKMAIGVAGVGLAASMFLGGSRTEPSEESTEPELEEEPEQETEEEDDREVATF